MCGSVYTGTGPRTYAISLPHQSWSRLSCGIMAAAGFSNAIVGAPSKTHNASVGRVMLKEVWFGFYFG